eukprot:scaffold29530_cov71-Phaeocystis_antarctica.AAC.4
MKTSICACTACAKKSMPSCTSRTASWAAIAVRIGISTSPSRTRTSRRRRVWLSGVPLDINALEVRLELEMPARLAKSVERTVKVLVVERKQSVRMPLTLAVISTGPPEDGTVV